MAQYHIQNKGPAAAAKYRFVPVAEGRSAAWPTVSQDDDDGTDTDAGTFVAEAFVQPSPTVELIVVCVGNGI